MQGRPLPHQFPGSSLLEFPNLVLGRVRLWKIGLGAPQVAVSLLAFPSKLTQLHHLGIINNHFWGNTIPCKEETKAS
jgi:hypothetical protein